MQRELYKRKNTVKNKDLVNVIKSGLLGLKIEIGKIPKNEIDIEQPDKIVNILEKILDINNQNQEEQELTMLTRDQMLG